jgi:hypothetical protein
MPVMNEDGTPNVSETHQRVKSRLRAGDHDGALEDAIWYWERALDHEPAQYGVRLSFFLSNMLELAEAHPPALAYIEGERASRLERLERGEIEAEGFHELTSIDEDMNGEETLLVHFATLERTQPDLANTLGPRNWRDFYTLGAWDLIERHPPDVERIIEDIADTLGDPELSASRHEYARGKGRALREVLTHLGRDEDLARLDAALEEHDDEDA